MSGVNNVAGKWRKKMVKENKSARAVFGNDLSIHNIAHNYVIHVLDVKENDSNFRNPVHLFHKSLVIGSSSSSDIAPIFNSFSLLFFPFSLVLDSLSFISFSSFLTTKVNSSILLVSSSGCSVVLSSMYRNNLSVSCIVLF